MRIFHTAIPILATLLLAACDDSVHLSYATRAEAEAEISFARGWLPDLIPPSSHTITMRNDLDLNTANGTFKFAPADHDSFVAHLQRVSSQDKDGHLAYLYRDWIFWINSEKNSCQFRKNPNP